MAITSKHHIHQFGKSIKAEIKSLVKLDNWHCILALLEDYFFIFISIFATYYITWFLYPLAVLVIGSRQRALATLLHEAAHGTLARNKYLNFAIGSFFSGYLIFQTFSSYRNSHVRFHHGHLGDPTLDPDYKFHIHEGLYDDIVSPKSFKIKFFILPLLLFKVPIYLRSLITQRLFEKEGKTAENILMVSFIGAIVICSILLNFWKIIIIFWLIPYLTIFQLLGWFIEISEHYPLVKIYDIDIYMTRNRKSHWLEAFFTGMHNEGYHLVHHLNPSIPFWNLHKAHKIYLQDHTYAGLEQLAGGIVVSSNNAPSILESVVNYLKLNYATQSSKAKKSSSVDF
jgi:fatty acid desaturase